MTEKKNLTVEDTFALAVQNQQKNNFQVAENLYKETLKINSNHIDAYNNLGIVYKELGELQKAVDCHQKVIQIQPDDVYAHYNLGLVFKELGEFQKAIDCYQKVIQIQPDRVEDAYLGLGLAFKGLGEYQKAKSCYEKAIEIDPNYAGAYNSLGAIFKELEEHQKAIGCYEKAIQINPNYAEVHYNLGLVFKELGENQKAIICYEKSIQLNPNYTDAYNNLGIVFKELQEHQKAIGCYEKAIQINPNDADAHNNFGVAFNALGEYKKAINCFQKAINLKSDYTKAHSNILFTLFYFDKVDPKYYFSQTKKFRSSLKPVNDNLLLKYQYDRRPKKLKIGFVSGDFKQHPVGYFLLDTLKHLKNKNLDLIAYSNFKKKDSLSIELKSHFTNWYEITDQNDEKVVNQIIKDGIHILFDLSGHSAKNRLPIFINKPAPIQVSWAGFPGSTNIPEIDYIIGDSFVTPLSENSHFTEKVFRLPNIWVCFSIPEFEVKIRELPAIKNGYITFGCFNNLSKINDKVISLWSKILKVIPKSKIFLKTMELNDTYLKKKIINNFKKNNINSDSIILEGFSPRNELFASYNRVDIALDPFPYSGGTTSFESTWMGTPVLTKRGFKFVSRTTESINHNCGMSDWVANDENEYVKKAIKFSANLERLSEIKKNLRKITLNSPLFNASLFAEHFKDTVWKMWKDFI